MNDVYITGLEECEEKSNELRYVLDSAADIIHQQSILIDNLGYQVSWGDSIISKQKALLKISDKEKEKLNKKLNLNIWGRNVLILGGLALLIFK